jgi:hypothetical protein
MPKRRRKCEDLTFPYEKSAIASGALIVAFLLFLAMLAEPQSGRIRDQRAVWVAMIALPFAIAAVFYVEHRLRNRHRSARKNRTPEGNLPAKC